MAQNSNLFTEYDDSSKAPVIVRFLMKIPFVNSQKQAEVLLIIVTLVILAASAYLIFIATRTPVIRTLPVN